MRLAGGLWELLSSPFFKYSNSNEITPFCIVFLARTGSNYLASLLDSHPDILCHHEVFNPEAPHRSLSVKQGKVCLNLGTAAERDANPWVFLRSVFSSPGELPDGRPNRVKAIGIKHAFNQGLLPFVSLMVNRNVKKVVLRRDNVLESYVSRELALKSGKWIRFDGSTAVHDQDVPTISVNLRDYLRYVRRIDTFYWCIRVLFFLTRQQTLELEFNVLVNQEGVRTVISFLALDERVTLQAKTRRQSTRGLADSIDNVRELRIQLLRRRRWRRHLAYLDEESMKGSPRSG